MDPMGVAWVLRRSSQESWNIQHWTRDTAHGNKCLPSQVFFERLCTLRVGPSLDQTKKIQKPSEAGRNAWISALTWQPQILPSSPFDKVESSQSWQRVEGTDSHVAESNIHPKGSQRFPWQSSSRSNPQSSINHEVSAYQPPSFSTHRS
jgi:hypothetical protein